MPSRRSSSAQIPKVAVHGHTSTSNTSQETRTGGTTTPGIIESSATSTAEIMPRALKANRPKKSKVRIDDRKLKGVGRPQGFSSKQDQAHYWSEYDHPEDADDSNAYYIYVYPNESVKFPGQEILEKMGKAIKMAIPKSLSLSTARRPELPKPSWTYEDDSDSDEGSPMLAAPGSHDSSSDHINSTTAYGTVPTPAPLEGSGWLIRALRVLNRDLDRASRVQQEQFTTFLNEIQQRQHERELTKARLYTVALLAALVILIIVATLADAGRRKQRRTVDAGIVLGVVANLVLTLTGIISACTRRERVPWWHWVCILVASTAVCVVDGWLLAWMVAAYVPL